MKKKIQASPRKSENRKRKENAGFKNQDIRIQKLRKPSKKL